MTSTETLFSSKGKTIYSRNYLISGTETSIALLSSFIHNSIEDQSEGNYEVDFGKFVMDRSHILKFSKIVFSDTYIHIEGVHLFTDCISMSSPLTEKLHLTTEFYRGPKDYDKYNICQYRKTSRSPESGVEEVEVKELGYQTTQSMYERMQEIGVLEFIRERISNN